MTGQQRNKSWGGGGSTMVAIAVILLCFLFDESSSFTTSSSSLSSTFHHRSTAFRTTSKLGNVGSSLQLQQLGDNDKCNEAADFGMESSFEVTSSTPSGGQSRRTALSTFATAAAAAVLSTGLSLQDVQVANAAEEGAPASANEIFLRLKNIPTFAIVNNDGIPLMIFDGQASATGYFFLSFNVAKTVLEDARSKDKSKDAADKWSDATIITIPLTVALQLGLRKVQRRAINTDDIKFNTYNDIVPAEEAVEDAKSIDSKSQNIEKWTTKGRVPIFYVNDKEFTVDDGMYPRFFNLIDLKTEWNKQFPNKELPKVEIIEMIELFRIATSPKGSLDTIRNLKFIPVQETRKVASELQKTTSSIKYNFKDVYLVQSAKG